jgi:hypothetical protein
MPVMGAADRFVPTSPIVLAMPLAPPFIIVWSYWNPFNIIQSVSKASI